MAAVMRSVVFKPSHLLNAHQELLDVLKRLSGAIAKEKVGASAVAFSRISVSEAIDLADKGTSSHRFCLV